LIDKDKTIKQNVEKMRKEGLTDEQVCDELVEYLVLNVNPRKENTD